MNKKISILAIAVGLALTGCGGGSDGGSSANANAASTPKAQVIDGYLVNAEVYVDRNDNKKADSGEKLAGVTDEQGYISLAKESDKEHMLIARAIVGKTFDTDKSGAITSSYELAAPAGATVVNPYTTLAVIEDKTMEEVAADLNINKALISGDYIKAKSGSDAAKAKETHLIARSLTPRFKDKIAESKRDKDAIKRDLKAIKKAVEEKVNNKRPNDIDNVVINVDKDGKTAIKDAPKTAKALLVGNTYVSISTNYYYFKNEGVEKLSFKNNNVLITNDDKKTKHTAPITYRYNGYEKTDGLEKIIFTADDFFISITPQHDITLMVNDTTGINDSGFTQDTNITEKTFTGKTLYALWDDNNKSANPRPELYKLIFAADDTVSLLKRKSETWVPFKKATWHVNSHHLAMDFDGNDTLNLSFSTLYQNGLRVMYEGVDPMALPIILIENEGLATNLYKQWVK